MSGLIGYQNVYRNTLEVMEEKSDILKFYPLIDWNQTLVDEYIEGHGLLHHPLREQVAILWAVRTVQFRA